MSAGPFPAEDLQALVLCEERGFTPGTTFSFDGLLWQREYARTNTLRRAVSGPFTIIEQNPYKEGSEWAPLVWPNHGPHAGCPGQQPHRILWVLDSRRRGSQCTAAIVDGLWHWL